MKNNLMEMFSEIINDLIYENFVIGNIDICKNRLYAMIFIESENKNEIGFWHIRINCNPDLLTIVHRSSKRQYRLTKNI